VQPEPLWSKQKSPREGESQTKNHSHSRCKRIHSATTTVLLKIQT